MSEWAAVSWACEWRVLSHVMFAGRLNDCILLWEPWLNYHNYLTFESLGLEKSWGPHWATAVYSSEFNIIVGKSWLSQQKLQAPHSSSGPHNVCFSLFLFLCASEQVRLDGGVGFSVEWGQDSSKGPGHTVRRLPGLQNLLSLDSRLGDGRVGRPQAGPAGRLQPLEHWRAGGVCIAAVGGSRAGAQACRAAQVSIGRARQGGRAVRRGAAGGLFGLIIIWWRSWFSALLPSRAAAAGAACGATRAVSFGVGCTLLLTKLGTPVLKPHLQNTDRGTITSFDYRYTNIYSYTSGL